MKPVICFSGVVSPIFDAVVAACIFLYLSVQFHMLSGLLRTFSLSDWILWKGLQQAFTPITRPYLDKAL